MNIKLNEFGTDNQLHEAAQVLRGALNNRLSRKDKDIRISKALGIVETIRQLIYIHEPYEEEEDEND